MGATDTFFWRTARELPDPVETSDVADLMPRGTAQDIAFCVDGAVDTPGEGDCVGIYGEHGTLRLAVRAEVCRGTYDGREVVIGRLLDLYADAPAPDVQWDVDEPAVMTFVEFGGAARGAG